jgi:hypothetical protein
LGQEVDEVYVRRDECLKYGPVETYPPRTIVPAAQAVPVQVLGRLDAAIMVTNGDRTEHAVLLRVDLGKPAEEVPPDHDVYFDQINVRNLINNNDYAWG